MKRTKLGRRGKGRGRHGGGRGAQEPSEAIVPHEHDSLDLGELEADALAPSRPTHREIAYGLLKQFRKRRASWRGHFHSFIGTNLGLAAINVLSMIGVETFYPWFLYVTAGWGIGLVIHGLSHRGWVKDHTRAIEQAEDYLGVSRLEGDVLPMPLGDTEKQEALKPHTEETPALPEHEGSGDSTPLLDECLTAVDAAKRAIGEAGAENEACEAAEEQLDEGLRTVEVIERGLSSIRTAIRAVAPDGLDALDREIAALDNRISAASDERLKGIYGANHRLLEARREKLRALSNEEERMKATIQGFLLAAQNVRLDAARLTAGSLPGNMSSLGDSLDRLNQEVEVIRQVEIELETL